MFQSLIRSCLPWQDLLTLTSTSSSPIFVVEQSSEKDPSAEFLIHHFISAALVNQQKMLIISFQNIQNHFLSIQKKMMKSSSIINTAVSTESFCFIEAFSSNSSSVFTNTLWKYFTMPLFDARVPVPSDVFPWTDIKFIVLDKFTNYLNMMEENNGEEEMQRFISNFSVFCQLRKIKLLLYYVVGGHENLNIFLKYLTMHKEGLTFEVGCLPSGGSNQAHVCKEADGCVKIINRIDLSRIVLNFKLQSEMCKVDFYVI